MLILRVFLMTFCELLLKVGINFTIYLNRSSYCNLRLNKILKVTLKYKIFANLYLRHELIFIKF